MVWKDQKLNDCFLFDIPALIVLQYNVFIQFCRQIKMSSPKLNNLIACGIMVAYVCVILIGIDGAMVDKETLVFICRVSRKE